MDSVNFTQKKSTIGALFLRGVFAKTKDLRVVHVLDKLLRLFAERIHFFGLTQIFQEELLVGVTLELPDQLFFACFSAIRVLLLDCRLRYATYSVVDVASGFPAAAECALVGGLEIFLLLDQVDPAVHFANSVSVQLEGTLETDLLCYMIHLQTSCILLSEYKSQEMYRRERLHVIVFLAPIHYVLVTCPSNLVRYDPWFIQIASNFFHTLIVVHRVHCSEKKDCLSLLRHFPPGINPLLIIECNSTSFRMWWMYSVKSSGNSTLSCNVRSTICPPECP